MAIAVNYPKLLNILTQTYDQAADVSSYQNCCVAYTGAATGKAQVTPVTSAGQRVAGVLYNAPNYTLNVVAQVLQLGIAPVKANGAITAGVEVTTGSDGRIQAAISGQWVIGTAMNAATAANEIIGVLMTGGYYKA